MPYLNLKESRIVLQVEPPSENGSAQARRRRTRMDIGFSREAADRLASAVDAIFQESSSVSVELRVDLPEGWVLFWKPRDGESRCLVAHPEESEWVATMALESAVGRRVAERLRALTPEDSLPLDSLASLGSVSNLELTLRVAG